MTTLGDFSSLFQLGVGTGIALSLFRAPVDFRSNRMNRVLDSELTALKNATSHFARIKRRNLLDFSLRFNSARDAIERVLLPFMVFAVMGAIANLVGLIAAALNADRCLSNAEMCLALFVTVIWFVLEIAALEVLARSRFSQLSSELDSLRAQKAPPAQLPQFTP